MTWDGVKYPIRASKVDGFRTIVHYSVYILTYDARKLKHKISGCLQSKLWISYKMLHTHMYKQFDNNCLTYLFKNMHIQVQSYIIALSILHFISTYTDTGSFLGVQRLGHRVNHPPICPEVIKKQYTELYFYFPLCLHGWLQGELHLYSQLNIHGILNQYLQI